MFNSMIPFYSISILLALLSNIIIVLVLSKKVKEFNNREIICILLYENFGIVCGAKILSYILLYKKIRGDFNFFKLGFVSYGAAIGAILLLLLFCFQFKKKINETINIFLPSMPLMYSIGKIGCFLVGCCYGIKYKGIGKVMYHYSVEAPNNIYLFPIQLLESIIFFFIFIYMLKMGYRNKINYKSISIFLILCGSLKFVLDFFRMAHNNVLLSFNQIISIIIIIIGFNIMCKFHNM